MVENSSVSDMVPQSVSKPFLLNPLELSSVLGTPARAGPPKPLIPIETEEIIHAKPLKEKEQVKYLKMYHDETLVSFFRRLSFTPDGSLLIVPAGVYKNPYSNDNSGQQHVAYIYARNQLKGY